MATFRRTFNATSIHHSKYRRKLQPAILASVLGLFGAFIQHMIRTTTLFCTAGMHQCKNRRETNSAIFTVELGGHKEIRRLHTITCFPIQLHSFGKSPQIFWEHPLKLLQLKSFLFYQPFDFHHQWQYFFAEAIFFQLAIVLSN